MSVHKYFLFVNFLFLLAINVYEELFEERKISVQVMRTLEKCTPLRSLTSLFSAAFIRMSEMNFIRSGATDVAKVFRLINFNRILTQNIVSCFMQPVICFFAANYGVDKSSIKFPSNIDKKRTERNKLLV